MGINKIYTIMNEMKEIAGISANKRLTPYRYMSTWGVVLFFFIRRLGPSINPPHKKIINKISGISSTPKRCLKFYKPPKISPMVCLEMIPKPSPIFYDPKNISTNSPYSINIHFFLNTPKNMEIQNFELKLWSAPTYALKRTISLRLF